MENNNWWKETFVKEVQSAIRTNSFRLMRTCYLKSHYRSPVFCRAAILIYLKCVLSFVFFLSFASSNVCNAPQRRRKAGNAFDPRNYGG